MQTEQTRKLYDLSQMTISKPDAANFILDLIYLHKISAHHRPTFVTTNMSQEEAVEARIEPQRLSKKRSVEEAELEIDVDAPEPPSKKALRKAKKTATKKSEHPEAETAKSEEPDLKRLNGLEGERSQFGVWIGNLAFTTAKKDLYNFLTTNSIPDESITRLHLPPGNDHRAQNKGFAYVDFNSQKLVEQAVLLSETLLGGRRLLIKDAKNYQGRPEKPKEQNSTPARASNRKIFVGNLHFETTVQELEKHFGVCGPILSTQMAAFQDSGKCKGYAWIEFESLAAAEDAMRGWVETEKPTKGDDGKKAMRTKKIWLHRMGDRKLRMEYAEDATTRYKKRFGHDSDDAAAGGKVKGEQNEAIVEVKPESGFESRKIDRKHHQRPPRPARAENRPDRGGRRPSQKSDSRYDDKTVQKLTGAIVEGKGSKLVFE